MNMMGKWNHIPGFCLPLSAVQILIIMIILFCQTLGKIQHDSKDLQVEWIWLNGNNVGNRHTATTRDRDKQIPVYPGARAGSSSWLDKNGKLWLFGGKGYDEKPTNEPRLLNDLWTFDSKTRLWKEISKDGLTTNSLKPSPRWMSVACGIHGIFMILYGGQDLNGNVLKDTWLYNVRKASWLRLHMFHSSHNNASINSQQTYPPPRQNPAAWCTRKSFVIFGGIGVRSEVLSDMWVFSLKDLKDFSWKEMKQYSLSAEVTGSSLYPEGRFGAMTWISNKTNLFLYGGSRKVDTQKNGKSNLYLMADIWMYSLLNQRWTVIEENKEEKSSLQDSLTYPGFRRGAATWVGPEGSLCVFGGEGISPRNDNSEENDHDSRLLSDVWKFHLPSEWTFVESSSRAMYGTKGKKTATSIPGPRKNSMSWTHRNITYFFGGLGKDARNLTTYLNDLWVLLPPNVMSLKSRLQHYQHAPPSTVFLITFSTMGGITLVFGAGFFIKKMIEYPRRFPSKAYNVKYSTLSNHAMVDMVELDLQEMNYEDDLSDFDD